jgi:hypothetical protein
VRTYIHIRLCLPPQVSRGGRWKVVQSHIEKNQVNGPIAELAPSSPEVEATTGTAPQHIPRQAW